MTAASKTELVDALAASRKARLDEILPDLSRDRLKELCRAFGLDDSGREKAEIAARLIGHPAHQKGKAPPARRPAAGRPSHRTPEATKERRQCPPAAGAPSPCRYP